MAFVVPLVAKVVVGAVVSKLVGQVTGNEVLGAVAGAFVGGGFSFDSATGGMSWANPLAGAAGGGATGAAGTDTVAATFDGSGPLTSFAEGGATDAATLSDFGSQFVPESIGGTGANVIPAASAVEPGILSKAANWMEANPKTSELGMKFIEGAMAPDELELLQAKGEQDRLTLAEKTKLKEAVDAGALSGRLEGVNRQVLGGGYQPGMLSVARDQSSPGYSSRVSPNLQNRLSSIYTPPSAEKKGVT